MSQLQNLEAIEKRLWTSADNLRANSNYASKDEEFDFEEAMQEIHAELADLNQEAVDLAARIQRNFEGLGI